MYFHKVVKEKTVGPSISSHLNSFKINVLCHCAPERDFFIVPITRHKHLFSQGNSFP